MFLWRNLPKGQLSAVLRWMCDRRPSPPQSPVKKSDGTASLPAEGSGSEGGLTH